MVVGGDGSVEHVHVIRATSAHRDGIERALGQWKLKPHEVDGRTNDADWQRALSVAYIKVGDVQVDQGDLAGALKSYRDSLAIAEHLAISDPRNKFGGDLRQPRIARSPRLGPLLESTVRRGGRGISNSNPSP
jgi:hypothetical protein